MLVCWVFWWIQVSHDGATNKKKAQSFGGEFREVRKDEVMFFLFFKFSVLDIFLQKQGEERWGSIAKANTVKWTCSAFYLNCMNTSCEL